MIKLQTLEQAKPGRKYLRKDTFEGHITDLIATSQTKQPGEQAFLVEQDPNWVTPPHYHGEHQFQVVTAGHGSIGSRHHLELVFPVVTAANAAMRSSPCACIIQPRKPAMGLSLREKPECLISRCAWRATPARGTCTNRVRVSACNRD